MNYLGIERIWALTLLAGTLLSPAFASSPMAPIPAELDSLAPSFAARRLTVTDFTLSRQQWATLHHYRKFEVRVRQINREGAWVRVDFDRTREGKPSKSGIYRMAWNEGEEGPAPFAQNQRLWIWVSPDNKVDGFEMGRAVHRWRHLPDGTVELQVLDEMIDGGTALVRMIPDRYSGSEVGKTFYWKGEGLCTGAAGTIPLGQRIHSDDLAEALTNLGPEAQKTSWVSPGTTSYEDELRVLLRDFAGPGVVADAATPGNQANEPFKLRLRMEIPSSQKKASDRQASQGGAGWNRNAAPAAVKKSSGGSLDSALTSLFGKEVKGKEKEKPAETSPATDKASNSSSQPGASSNGTANPGSAAIPSPSSPASPPAGQAVAATPPPAPEPEKVRFDERWFDVLKEKALKHRKLALDALSNGHSPGNAVSQTWVEVAYENRPGEPLRATAATLPLVPKKQFVPESRVMP
jgi:hypothetical protein